MDRVTTGSSRSTPTAARYTPPSLREERLGHDTEEEIAIALGEIAKIARLRLEELDA